MAHLPILSALLLLPILAAVATLLLPARWCRPLSLTVTVGGLLVAALAVTTFEAGQTGFQLLEEAPWMPSLGVHYRVGVDGLSVLFLPATQVLFLSVFWLTGRAANPRLHVSLLLLLQSALLGVFCALDGILFFLCWELTLLPLYFLVGLWGSGTQRREAADQYVLTMLAVGVPILIAFLILAFHVPGAPSFDIRVWLDMPLSRSVQFTVFLLMLAGFGAKVPLFPLHNWLPAMAMQGPTAVLALVTGLKIGAFALIRLAVPLAPEAATELHWLLAGLGTVSLLFGAGAALAQTNLRAMLAYASVSHVGLVVLGLSSLSQAGVEGAVFQLLNFSLASGGLFLLAGLLHQRTGTLEAAQLGGAARRLPWIASFFLVLGLASIGVPGTSGFPAELMLLLAIFEDHAGAALAALAGAGMGAAAFLGLYRRLFFGPLTAAAVVDALDLKPSERRLFLLLVLLVLILGLMPGLLTEIMAPASRVWAARLP